jgi:tellurite methyltransferase
MEMTIMNIPFWEETYKRDDVFTFGSEPNNTIIEFEKLFNKSGNVLDVGCGDGKNSLYLAKHGFSNIDAFDLSKNAINKLERLAHKEDININAWVDDVCSFCFKKTYDLIISFGTLHFVNKDNWHRFILDAKENTVIGGFHIIQLFTDKVPASPDIALFAVSLASEEEIKELYNDWNIIQFKSYVFEDEHPDVPKHLHASNKIVVQRSK